MLADETPFTRGGLLRSMIALRADELQFFTGQGSIIARSAFATASDLSP
jgi:hypothetical protein